MRQGLQPADAEDVVQQVFTAIFQSVEKWLEQSERGRFRNWLIGIGRNVALNMLNRKPKEGSVSEARIATIGLIECRPPKRNSHLSLISNTSGSLPLGSTKSSGGRRSQDMEAFRMTHVDGVSIGESAQRLALASDKSTSLVAVS